MRTVMSWLCEGQLDSEDTFRGWLILLGGNVMLQVFTSSSTEPHSTFLDAIRQLSNELDKTASFPSTFKPHLPPY